MKIPKTTEHGDVKAIQHDVIIESEKLTQAVESLQSNLRFVIFPLVRNPKSFSCKFHGVSLEH